MNTRINIRNVTNFFSIFASEIADGLWTVKWSSDLETVHMYPVPEEPGEPGGPGDGDSGVDG